MYKKVLHLANLIICSVFITLVFSVNSSAQGRSNTRIVELTAQGILARVDRILDYPMGKLTGRIKHVYPSGKTYTINFTGLINKEDFLFNFHSRDRGNELKVLYNLNGEDIWVYNVHALKLFHKISIDKYDPILATNFCFIDLSNADLQSNYSAKIVGKAKIKGLPCHKLELKPIFKDGTYGLLTLYVSTKDYVPLRIDYHDRDKALFKFMTVAKVKIRNKRIVPVRYDMMDIRTGTLTIMSLFGIQEDMKFDAKLFRSEELGRR